MMRFSNKMQNIGTQLSTTVTLPILAAGGAALKAAASYESLRVSFQTLTKDVAKGNKLFDDLVKFAEKTPFNMEEVAGAAKTMLAYGRSIEQTMSDMAYLGDVAAATGGDIQGLSVIMGQGAALGKFMTVDLKQLSMRGIPILQELGKQLGVTEAQILEMAGKSQISFSMVESAIKKMTQNGGIYYQAMDKQSRTLSGLFSTLQDSATSAFAEIGMSIKETFKLDEVIQKLTDRIKGAAEWFKNLSEEKKRFIVIAAATAAAIGPLLIGISSTVKMVATAVTGFKALLFVFGGLTTWTGAVAAGIAVLAGILFYAYQHNEKFRKDVDKLIISFKELYNSDVIQFLKKAQGEFIKLEGTILKSAVSPLKVLWKWMNGGAEATSEFNENVAKQKEILDRVTKPVEDATTKIKDLAGANEDLAFKLDDVAGSAKEVKKEIKSLGILGELNPTLGTLSSDALGNVPSATSGNVPGISGDLQGALDKLKQGSGITSTWMDNFDRMADSVRNFAQEWSGAFNSINDLISQAFENRSAAIESAYESERKRIEGSRMSEEAKQLAMQKLEADTDRKRRKLARAQAIREKALGIIQATIATAVNVAKNIANPILAAITAAAGAAQIALIASQKIPALAKGGLAYGPQMAMVGDNPGARVDPEVIAPLSKLEGMLGNAGPQRIIVEGRISGKDILLSNERASQDRLRTRGF